MHKLRKSKGFTLIELMVVVAIIGILAAVAVPKFLAFLARSRKSEARTTLTGVYNASEGYFAEYEWYGDNGSDSPLWVIGYAPAGEISIYDELTGHNTCAPSEGSGCGSPSFDSHIDGEATDKGATNATFTYGMEGNIDTDSYLDLWITSQARRAPCNVEDDLINTTTTNGDAGDSACPTAIP